jgi:hypothetical protein
MYCLLALHGLYALILGCWLRVRSREVRVGLRRERTRRRQFTDSVQNMLRLALVIVNEIRELAIQSTREARKTNEICRGLRAEMRDMDVLLRRLGERLDRERPPPGGSSD